MKLILSIALLVFFVNANSQFIKKVGIKGIAPFELYCSGGDNLSPISVNITYDINKFQLIAGVVLTNYTETDESNPTHLLTRFGITGGTIGTNYYLNSSNKVRPYIFLEGMYLNYHTYDAYIYGYNNNQTLLVGYSASNKTTIFQGIIGSGTQIKIVKFINLSIDFGFGLRNRSLKYDNTNMYTNYITEIKSYIGQLRLGLGFNL